jgi:hypothetical protein
LFVLPDWIPSDLWRDFEAMRQKKRKPLTDRARTLAVGALQKACNGCHQPQDVMSETILHGWDTFYPLKDQTNRSNEHQLRNLIMD